jgi:hypothetical protein
MLINFNLNIVGAADKNRLYLKMEPYLLHRQSLLGAAKLVFLRLRRLACGLICWAVL